MIARGEGFADGEIVRLPGADAAVKIIRANDTARTQRTPSRRSYGTRIPIMQVVLPDRDGKFPDPNGRPPYADIPILRAM